MKERKVSKVMGWDMGGDGRVWCGWRGDRGCQDVVIGRAGVIKGCRCVKVS